MFGCLRQSETHQDSPSFQLSGELRRKIGLKALELGGNAVVGYRQNFDLEGESGIVVRGIGTAVTLSRLQPGDLTLTPATLSPARDNSVGPAGQSTNNTE